MNGAVHNRTMLRTGNIAAHLARMAEVRPDMQALLVPRGKAYDTYTYAQLNALTDRLAHGLVRAGVGPGVRTALMVPPSAEFFALTFALFKVGAVPVLIDPGMGVKNLKKCLHEARPSAFIGITKAHAARQILRWARSTVRVCVTVGPRLFWGGLRYDDLLIENAPPFPAHEPEEEETAAILFTSGSTGPPKGAIYTHAIFGGQVELLRDALNIKVGEVDLCTFPLFALFAPALGMTAVVPRMDFTRPARVDPREVIGPIHAFNVTNMFGSPALIDRVGRWAQEHGEKLPSLKRAISAGAPVPAQVMQRFAKLLSPGAQVYTPYGATEALPVAIAGSDFLLSATREKTERGAGVCVGKPLPQNTVKIMAISDEPVARLTDDLLQRTGVVGEIIVSGPTVTRGYDQRPEADALSKMTDSDGRLYHRMGDLGYFDEAGMLWFCGRKAHRVTICENDKERTLFTIPCEAIFNTHPKVRRTALVGVTRDGAGSGATEPVLCVELEAGATADEWPQVREQLLQIGRGFEHTRMIETLLLHPSFPVDIRHNAKIFREKLAVWAQQQLR